MRSLKLTTHVPLASRLRKAYADDGFRTANAANIRTKTGLVLAVKLICLVGVRDDRAECVAVDCVPTT